MASATVKLKSLSTSKNEKNNAIKRYRKSMRLLKIKNQICRVRLNQKKPQVTLSTNKLKWKLRRKRRKGRKRGMHRKGRMEHNITKVPKNPIFLPFQIQNLMIKSMTALNTI